MKIESWVIMGGVKTDLPIVYGIFTRIEITGFEWWRSCPTTEQKLKEDWEEL